MEYEKAVWSIIHAEYGGDCLRNTKNKKRNVLKKIFHTGFIVLLFVLAIGIFFAVDILDMHEWHELDVSIILDAPQTLTIYDKDGKVASFLYSKEDRRHISIDALPKHVTNAFIAVEDTRFYEHGGIDIIRMAGAAIHDIKTGTLEQGASTLSQQLIKLSHLLNEDGIAEKTIARKAEEAFLACRLELLYEKDDILEMYLNYVYFGGGYYGIEAAAQGYFGVSASDISIAQAAQLAGILKAPNTYAPHINMEKSIERRNLVIGLMRDEGFISNEEHDAAIEERVILNNETMRNIRNYYIDMTIDECCEILSITKEELLTGGYEVYTALDTGLQEQCEELLLDDTYFPAPSTESALVVMDVKSGMVCAVMGGREYEVAHGFNRATDIRRQPGSVIKPIIVYAPALEYYGFTAASFILDEPVDIDGYSPKNADGNYRGWVTLREAVTRSLNVPAVKVLSNVGVETGKLFAERLGIEFDEKDNGLALALGGFTYGVSPWQLAEAYAAFASYGTYREAGLVTKICDAEGTVLYEHDAGCSKVMSGQTAYILTSMLKSVVDEGTGKELSSLPYEIAGKTGTVGDEEGTKDAWMVAYTSDYVVASWMGNDDGSLMPKDTSGGKYPAKILSGIFSYIYRDGRQPSFLVPDGITECRLDGFSLSERNEAVLATAFTPANYIVREVFAEGTEPTSRSDVWTMPIAPSVSLNITLNGLPEIEFLPIESHVTYVLYREDSLGRREELLVYSGDLNPVKYVDYAVAFGINYSYYVVPRNDRIIINGAPMYGIESNRVHFLLNR